MPFKCSRYNYKGKFKTIFEEITKVTPVLSVNILDECAATAIYQNIHGHNELFENTNDRGHIGIIIQCIQNEEYACGFFFNWLVLYIMFRIKS